MDVRDHDVPVAQQIERDDRNHHDIQRPADDREARLGNLRDHGRRKAAGFPPVLLQDADQLLRVEHVGRDAELRLEPRRRARLEPVDPGRQLREEVRDLPLDERHEHEQDRNDDEDHDQEDKAHRDRARHAPLEPVDEWIAQVREQCRQHERREHGFEQPDHEAGDADQDQPLPADVESLFAHRCFLPAMGRSRLRPGAGRVRHARELHTTT